jgi:hypothetical protein
MKSKPRMTRRELAAFLTERGYPISYQTLTRLCMPGNYRGPPTAGRWSKFAMHDPSVALEWARRRFVVRSTEAHGGHRPAAGSAAIPSSRKKSHARSGHKIGSTSERAVARN